MVLIISFIFFTLAPCLFWLWFYRYNDREEPEPKKLLFILLLLGASTALVAAALEETVLSLVFPRQTQLFLTLLTDTSITQGIFMGISLFFAGVVEETLKLVVVREYVYSKLDFNQIADGIIYGVTVAIGFSFIENMLYLIRFFLTMPPSLVLANAFIRGFITTPLHFTATGIAGYALGKKKFSINHSKKSLVFFLGIAIVGHGIFNLFTFIPFGIILSIFLVIGQFIFLQYVLRKPDSRIIWRLVTPKSY